MATDEATTMPRAVVDDKLAEIRIRNEQLRRRFAEEEADRNEAMAKGMSVTAEQSRSVRTAAELDVRSRLQPRGKPAGNHEEDGEPLADDPVDFEYDDNNYPIDLRGAEAGHGYSEDGAPQQRRVQVRSGGPNRYNLVVSVIQNDGANERDHGSQRRPRNLQNRGQSGRSAPQHTPPSQSQRTSTERPSVHDRLGWNPRAGPGRGNARPNQSARGLDEPILQRSSARTEDSHDGDCEIEYDFDYDIRSATRHVDPPRGEPPNRRGEPPNRRGEPSNRRGQPRSAIADRRFPDDNRDRTRPTDLDGRAQPRDRRHEQQANNADVDLLALADTSLFDRGPPPRDGRRYGPPASGSTRTRGSGPQTYQPPSSRGRNPPHNRNNRSDADNAHTGTQAPHPPARTQSQEDDPYRIDERDFATYFHRIVENVRSKGQPSNSNDPTAATSPSTDTAPGYSPVFPPASGQSQLGTYFAQPKSGLIDAPSHLQSAGANLAYAVAESVIETTYDISQQDNATSPVDEAPPFFDRQTSNTSAAYERQSSSQYDASKQPRMLRGRGVNPTTPDASSGGVNWFNEVQREQQERMAERSATHTTRTSHQPAYQPAQRPVADSTPSPVTPSVPYQNPAVSQSQFAQPGPHLRPQPPTHFQHAQSRATNNPHDAPVVRFAPPAAQLAQFAQAQPPFVADQNSYAHSWNPAPVPLHYAPPQQHQHANVDRFAPNTRPPRGGAHSFTNTTPAGSSTSGAYRYSQKAPLRPRNQQERTGAAGNLPDVSAIERANAEVDLRNRLGGRGAPARGDRRRADRGRRRPVERDRARAEDDDFEDVEEQVIVGDVGDEENA